MTFLQTFAAVARALRDAGGWVPGFALFEEYGRRVYPILRRLEADGLLERREIDGGAERGYRPRALYRWTAHPVATSRPEPGVCTCPPGTADRHHP